MTLTWQAVWNALPLVLPAAAAGALAALLPVILVAWIRRRRARRRDMPTLRSDMAELAGQLEDYARQIDRQVGERLDRLEELLAKADGKTSELRRLLEGSGTAAAEARPDPRAADEQVVALAAQGLDSIEIAHRLRMDVGAVELMLNLHRSQASPRP